MPDAPSITGGCQCGAVRYRLSRPPSEIMCQKAVGGYFGAFATASLEDVVWTKAKPSFFASSEAAERGFCPACGTPLSFAYRGSGRISVSCGSLDDPAAYPPKAAYGVEGRVDWFDDLCLLSGTRTEDALSAEDPERYRSRQHPDCDL